MEVLRFIEKIEEYSCIPAGIIYLCWFVILTIIPFTYPVSTSELFSPYAGASAFLCSTFLFISSKDSDDHEESKKGNMILKWMKLIIICGAILTLVNPVKTFDYVLPQTYSNKQKKLKFCRQLLNYQLVDTKHSKVHATLIINLNSRVYALILQFYSQIETSKLRRLYCTLICIFRLTD